MLHSKAILVEPETAPQEVDQRPYMLASRVNVAIKTAKLSVGSVNASELTASLPSRRRVYLKNLDGSPDLYVGGLSVDTTDGYVLQEQEELWLDLMPSAKVFGITETQNADVCVLEVGVVPQD